MLVPKRKVYTGWRMLIPKKALNFALFCVAWSACIVGGTWIAIPVTALTLFIHLKFVNTRRGEAEMLILVALMGTLIDSILMHMRVIHFEYDEWLVPFWLTCAWLIFATTLNYACAFLKRRPSLCAVAGGILGPIVYFASMRLGVVSFSRFTWYSITFLALSWASVMWLLPKLAEQITEERAI